MLEPQGKGKEGRSAGCKGYRKVERATRKEQETERGDVLGKTSKENNLCKPMSRRRSRGATPI